MERELKVSDPQILLDKISRFFPNIRWEKYLFLSHSWEFQVIILDNSTVFRFPTSKSLIPTLKHEIELLKHIKTKSKLSFPRYKFIAPDSQFAGYDIIRGHELDHNLYHQLSEGDRLELCTNIGTFLNDLHNTYFPPEFKKHSSMRELLDEDSQLLLKSNRYLKNMLSEKDFISVKDVLSKTMKLRNQENIENFLHGDFYGRHILWDPSVKYTGFIDFSDASFGDPAIDFAELFEFGVPFTKSIFSAYGGTDDDILERAVTYYQRVGVFLMINSFEDTKISFDEAHKLFSNALKISLY